MADQPFNPAAFIPPPMAQGGGGVPVPLASSPDTVPSADPTANQIPNVNEQPTKGFGPGGVAAAADLQHHSMVGRLVKAVMGTQTTFQPQPDGSIKAVDEPQKPGTLFRGMLLSAMLGSGTQAHTFGEGFGKGIAATAERGIENRDKDRAQAIQNEELKQRKQAADDARQHRMDEHDKAKATIAASTVSTAHMQYALDHLPLEQMERVNTASQMSQQAAYKAGGKDAQIIVDGKNINGQMGNSVDWEKAVAKNPELIISPDKNYTRHFTTTTTPPPNAEIKNGQWVDKTTGQIVDMHKYSTMRAIDVPTDSLTQMQELTGAEANKLMGTRLYEPDQKVNMSFGDILSVQKEQTMVALERAKEKNEEARTWNQKLQADKSAEILERSGRQTFVSSIKDSLTSIDKELGDEEKSYNPDQNRMNELKAQASALRAQLIGAAASLTPEVKFNKTQEKEIDTLPKPVGGNTIMPLDVMPKYMAMFPNDPTGNMAHAAAMKNGWTGYAPIPKPAAAATTGAAAPQMTPEQAAGALGGGGNTAPAAPITSSRDFVQDSNKPGSGPF